MVKRKNLSSSSRWLKECSDDKYINEARRKGYRSRSIFKIEEIQRKEKIFKPGMRVVDLGASPGGWSQYVVGIIGESGYIFSCDLLPMSPINGVKFLQLQEKCQSDSLLNILDEECRPGLVDVILSDMSPSITGNSFIDQPRAISLAELALDACNRVLKFNGSFVVKVFQGKDSDRYIKQVRCSFSITRVRKPDASRARSKEIYVVAKGYKRKRVLRVS